MLVSQVNLAQKLPVSISYYGDNGYHPGIKFGTYFTIWSLEKSRLYYGKKRQEKYGMKHKLHELNLEFNIGGYSHPNSHNGYFVNTGLSFLRTQLRKNYQIGMGLEIGYLRRNYKFTTYQLDSNGEIEEVKGAGNNSFLLGLAPQFSREFSIFERPIRFYIRPIFQMVYYINRIQPTGSLELGAVVNIHRKETNP
jgi:hypothetical protein